MRSKFIVLVGTRKKKSKFILLLPLYLTEWEILPTISPWSGAKRPILSLIAIIDGLNFIRAMNDLDLYVLRFNLSRLC